MSIYIVCILCKVYIIQDPQQRPMLHQDIRYERKIKQIEKKIEPEE